MVALDLVEIRKITVGNLPIVFLNELVLFFLGTYDSGIGSLTLHPYQYATNEYGAHDTHQQSIHSYEHPLEQTKQNRKMNPHPSNNPPSDIHSLGTNDRSRTMNMDQIHGPTKPSRLPEKKKNDIKTHQQVNILHYKEERD